MAPHIAVWWWCITPPPSPRPPVPVIQELEELQGQLEQQVEQVAELEVQLLQQQVMHLEELQASEQAVSSQCLSAAAEAVQVMQAALQDLHQALEGPKDDTTPMQDSTTTAEACYSSGTVSGDRVNGTGTADDATGQQLEQQESIQLEGRPKRWLSRAAAEMLGNTQVMLDQLQARARLVAARQHVGVQSDEAMQSQCLRFIRGLPDAAVPQPLHLKAASEAVLRIYMRGLSQLEAQSQQQRQQAPGGAAGLGGSGGSVLTVFDLLIAHYTPPSALQHQQQHGRLSVQPYSAALWKDPQVCAGKVSFPLLGCCNSQLGEAMVPECCGSVKMLYLYWCSTPATMTVS